MICWQCHEPTTAAVCVGCSTIQPPPVENEPFSVLGLERRFHLEKADIESAWRKLSKQIHPDRYAGKPAVYRRMSLQWTALVNEARRILLDPMSRARMLATGSPKAPERGGPMPDPDFLETIFELQMEAEADSAAARQTVEEMWDRERSRLDGIFTRWEANEGDLGEVEDSLAKLKYLQTARNQSA